MDDNREFFERLEHQILDKSVITDMPNGCRLWTGAVTNNYGRKRVKYPNGTTKLEYVSRLVYMYVHRVLIIPANDINGNKLDMSHLCNNTLCVLPQHLVLEPHNTNMERRHCFNQFICTRHHIPYCLI